MDSFFGRRVALKLASWSAGTLYQVTAAIRADQLKLSVAQGVQKVHSKEQIRASVESGGRSLSQHSQEGLSSSIEMSLMEKAANGRLLAAFKLAYGGAGGN